jgi:predicted RNA-binding Zn-ribbon protein involved in translation (DUF1610 family)
MLEDLGFEHSKDFTEEDAIPTIEADLFDKIPVSSTQIDPDMIPASLNTPLESIQYHPRPPMGSFYPQGTLYPPLQHTFPQSSSLASIQSLPTTEPSMLSSQSDQSLTSTVSFTNSISTPLRDRRPSTALSFQSPTVSPITRQTPSRRLRTHHRTRSRLSLDASGAASIILEPGLSLRSPARNPFYTPSQHDSPHVVSPVSTPLMAPHMRQEEDYQEQSVYPMMLQHEDYAEAANMTFRIAEQQHLQSTPFFLSDPSVSESAVPQTIPQYPIVDNNYPQSHEVQPPQNQQLHHQQAQLQLPLQPQHSQFNSAPQHQYITQQPAVSQLLRSQSVLNLHSHLTPPEITKLDIMVPRKRLSKSQSVSDLDALGKKQKKLHQCPLCGSIFQRPEHLKRHMRSHSSEKPFECDECGKKFNRADNMKAHQRKMHGF